MRVATGALLALALLVAGAVAPSVRAQGLEAIIDGRDAIGVGAAAHYNVTVSGGPGAEGGILTVKYWLKGGDLTGATPTVNSPTTTTVHNSTRALLNVTAPTHEQVVTLVVEVNSSKSGSFATTSVTKAIAVVIPVMLKATFRNTSGVAAVNVTVEFAVDGTRVGTTTVARINAGDTAVAQLSWLPVGLAPGTHTVTASGDLNGNGVIEPQLGEVQSSNFFYKSSPELPWGFIALIVVAIILSGLIANSAIRRRRQQRA